MFPWRPGDEGMTWYKQVVKNEAPPGKLRIQGLWLRGLASRATVCCPLLFPLITEHRSQGCLLLPPPATSIHPEGQAHAGRAESSLNIFSLLAEWFSNCSVYRNHLQALLKHRLPGPTPRLSALVGLGWSPRTCISNSFPGDADGAGLVTTLWESLFWQKDLF